MPTESGAYKAVLVALRQILKATDRQAKLLAQDTGLTTPHFITLQTIGNAPRPISAGELARELNLKQATTTAILNRLQARGLVTRQRDESDKRRVFVSVTEAGQTLLNATPSPIQNLLEARFARLENWERMQIVATLQRLASLMDASGFDAAPLLEYGSLQESATYTEQKTGDVGSSPTN